MQKEHLSQYEQETVINFNRDEKGAIVYTADPYLMHKLDAFCEQQPENFSVSEEHHFGASGEVYAKTYKLASKKLIKIRMKNYMPDEQKEKARLRFQKMWQIRKEAAHDSDI